MAGGFSQPTLTPTAALSPAWGRGVSGWKSWAGVWASQPRGEDLPTCSGRVGVVFAALLLARVRKRSLHAFVPVNPWRGKGV